jgi:large subunit ribosomal protein L9
MKVILRQNVPSLGKAGDLIKVHDGYARNLLIPKGLALEANEKSIKTFEHEKKNILQKTEKELKAAQDRAVKLADVSITIARKVGDQDKIFGSVTSKDIELALKEKGYDIDKKMIIHDEQIKSLGEFKIKIKIASGIETEIKLNVIGE